jgi:hypothetical protein
MVINPISTSSRMRNFDRKSSCSFFSAISPSPLQFPARPACFFASQF